MRLLHGKESFPSRRRHARYYENFKILSFFIFLLYCFLLSHFNITKSLFSRVCKIMEFSTELTKKIPFKRNLIKCCRHPSLPKIPENPFLFAAFAVQPRQPRSMVFAFHLGQI